MEQDFTNNEDTIGFLKELQDIIDNRKRDLPEDSYTAKLFKRGINKIAQKVGEEAVELVIEAKDDDRDLLLNEAADLFYHVLVLLSAKDCRIEDVTNLLRLRHEK